MDVQNPGPEDLLCDESFQRFCRGEQEADVLWWQNWIAAHPEQVAVVNSARHLFTVLSAGQGSRIDQLGALQDALLRRDLFAGMLAKKAGVQPATPAPVVTLNRRAGLRYVAAAAVLLVTGAMAYIIYDRKFSPALYNYEYYTSLNNRKTVMLPDSSVVMLNENSHLSVAKNFDASHREVTITGEAFFDITNDASHPFVVHASAYGIRVLGTSFNVRSYPGDKGTETDLITGKVEIVPNAGTQAKERVVLKPNQKFVWERDAVTATKSGASIMPGNEKVAVLKRDTITHHVTETSWARRKMEINDESFEQIAEKLQAWYGIKIIFSGNTVRQYRYTATFDDETIFKVLHYLQQSYQFTYTVKGDSIVITQS